jgi:hypothetical protein
MQGWKRFWRLSAAERRIVLAAAAMLIATRAALRLVSFRAWKAVLQSTIPHQPPQAHVPAADKDAMRPSALEPSQPAGVLVRLDAAASRHLIFRARCLERSLVLWWLLRRRRIPAELCIGASKQTGNFEAHAWVELDGTVLDDSEEARRHFIPFGAISTPKAELP